MGFSEVKKHLLRGGMVSISNINYGRHFGVDDSSNLGRVHLGEKMYLLFGPPHVCNSVRAVKDLELFQLFKPFFADEMIQVVNVCFSSTEISGSKGPQ